MFINLDKNIKNLHGLFVHTSICVPDPWHGSPPFLAFIIIDLDFCLCPVPQDLEHELQSLQEDHSQLTEISSMF